MSFTPFIRLLSIGLLCSSLLGLSACESNKNERTIAQSPTQAYYPPLRYANFPTFRFDVAKIEIIQEYQSPFLAPNVEHFFPIPPAEAIKTWVKDRMVAEGQTGVLQIIIRDASVHEVPLPAMAGIQGMITTQQSERYDGSIEMIMFMYRGDRSIPDAELRIKSKRSRTIAEGAEREIREDLFYRMTVDLMSDINREARNNIPVYFANFIVRPPQFY